MLIEIFFQLIINKDQDKDNDNEGDVSVLTYICLNVNLTEYDEMYCITED